MAELRQLKQSQPDFPDVVLVFRGEPGDGQRFFDAVWPDARAIADPDGSLYAAFGLDHATWKQAFGWAVWKAGFRALLAGHFVGAPGRDPWRMPGVFLVRDERIFAAPPMAHVGEQPDFLELSRALA